MEARTPKVWQWCTRCERLRLRIDFHDCNQPNRDKLPDCKACRRLRSRRYGRSLRGAGDKRHISAKRAQAHLRMLSKASMGRRAVSEVTGINDRTLRQITDGKQKKLRLANETLILNVTPDLHADGAFVDSAPTIAIVRQLKQMGITKREIARCFGSKAKVPQFDISQKLITARKAADVERLYRIITNQRPRKEQEPCLPSTPVEGPFTFTGNFLFPQPKPANGRRRESANS